MLIGVVSMHWNEGVGEGGHLSLTQLSKSNQLDFIYLFIFFFRREIGQCGWEMGAQCSKAL